MENSLDILCHALGRDKYGQSTSKTHGGKDWRNHFCTGPESDDFSLCRDLVAQGLMVEYPPTVLTGGSHTFVVTEKGVEFIALNAPEPPAPTKLSKSKQRYQRYREYGDMFNSFREFLSWDADPERSWNHSAKCDW